LTADRCGVIDGDRWLSASISLR